MPTIAFSGIFRRHLIAEPGPVAGATVRDALENVFATNPRLRNYLLDDQGAVRKHVVIYLNDHPITDRGGQSDRVSEQDEIFVFQALSGG